MDFSCYDSENPSDFIKWTDIKTIATFIGKKTEEELADLKEKFFASSRTRKEYLFKHNGLTIRADYKAAIKRLRDVWDWNFKDFMEDVDSAYPKPYMVFDVESHSTDKPEDCYFVDQCLERDDDHESVKAHMQSKFLEFRKKVLTAIEVFDKLPVETVGNYTKGKDKLERRLYALNPLWFKLAGGITTGFRDKLSKRLQEEGGHVDQTLFERSEFQLSRSFETQYVGIYCLKSRIITSTAIELSLPLNNSLSLGTLKCCRDLQHWRTKS